MLVAAFHKAIDDAEDAIDNLFGARYRLHDIEVHEVSIVDRAANRTKFLVIKNKEGTTMADGTQKALKIPKPVKAAVAGALTEALERLVSVANMVKNAEETDEQLDSPLPESIGKELKAISSILGSVTEKYPAPSTKSEPGPVAAVLTEVGQLAMKLAGEAASDTVVNTAMLTGVQELAKVLGALIERGQTTKDAGGGNAMSDTTSTTPSTDGAKPPAAAPPPAPPPAAAAQLSTEQTQKLEELQKAVAGLSSSIADLLKPAGSPAPQPAQKSDLDGVVSALSGFTAQLKDLVASIKPAEPAAPAPAAPPAQPSEDVAKRLKSIEEKFSELHVQVSKALETPPSRASSVATPSGTGEGAKVLPMFYNHPVYDPQAAKG